MIDWTSPALLPTLPADAIHVWRLYLPSAKKDMEQYLTHLSELEKIACLRFKFPDLQRRYALTRFGLRYLLAHYTQHPMNQVTLAIGEHGKPYLPHHSIHFNVSHSGDYALYAFSNIPNILLGIDIEKISNRHELAIAKRFFAPAEYEALAKLPEPQQSEAFFHIWTQKEAFIKAIGKGLSYPLDTFETTATGPAQLKRIDDKKYETLPWNSNVLNIGEDYKACVTCSCHVSTYQYFSLTI